MTAVGGIRFFRARARFALALIVALLALGNTPAVARGDSTLAVLVPIVSDQSNGDLLTADELEFKTAPGGDWSIVLDAAASHNATLALDSRIVASITALGDDAPESTRAWLERTLEERPIMLPWGNADPFVLAGVGRAYRVSTIALSEISGVPSADFVGWPTGRAGSVHSARRLEALGFTALIADDRVFPEAATAVSGDVSEQIAKAVAPGSTTNIAETAEQLRSSANGFRSIVFPRNPLAMDAHRVVVMLESLLAHNVTVRRFVPSAIGTVGSPVLTDIPQRAIRQLMSEHRTDRRVSEIAVDPSVITIPRLRRVSFLAGMVDRDSFPSVIRDYSKLASDFSEFVTVEAGSDFTVLANTTELPLTIKNSTSSEVSVIATVDALSAIVNIQTPSIPVTIPANSSVQVLFPMTSVANGSTSLRATLVSANGDELTEPTLIAVDVQAQWETLALVGFISFVGVILAIGIARTIRDRKART